MLRLSSKRCVTALFLVIFCACDEDKTRTTQSNEDANQCLALEPVCEPDASMPCMTLFGRPNEKSGLPDNLCGPACQCEGTVWTPLPVSGPEVDSLRARQLTNAFEMLTADPYGADAPPNRDQDAVCGVLLNASNPNEYELQTFESRSALIRAGAQLTHYGQCGLCSTLKDLAVYIANPDLTEPVRACGLQGFTGGPEAQLECIKALGFTTPCAQIWSYNTSHTGTVCRDICLSLLSAPYHEADGSPNACILCDEEKSGPVFKAVAGRTRRNSGLPTALCRPCDDVRRVDHRYRRALD